ncbi:YbhB/YbcL family Raf kinase inhibitor-like protein [Methylocystis heyeri]|uniref:YbhB/YbcL family Raf kinase inhibitor-like protein n=1 Tax=Methylocystis heyeri TaxID=391905 RepID=A0A6B8KF22_9HYPH|nr:YbhB/YbcL family Raf kinase inhibitor-like protein [Methylocystis heyeri]QGM47064.1 YbhB/YbcL family Raf kinase inhibitor-like protein [Methylocystis heyeri]
MMLTSTAFHDGAVVPRRFTCDGENLSPALQWTCAPMDAKSFALLCDDPDAPAGTWRHWAVFDIPSGRSELAEGAGRAEGFEDFRQGVNDFGEVGYGGPCPPRGHGPHRYRFRLIALNRAELVLRPGATCKEVEQEAGKHLLAEAVLEGVYQR